ncbi:MAG: IS110 family transposase [Acidobacteriota bacterium]|nr:IS110 family transposase [Acidobacteriota bacterium]
MKLLYRRCAGLDIHKDSISVCIRMRVSGKAEAEVLESRFSTFTQELERLAAFLKEHKVRQVAMESTGVYWRPVWNILEHAKYGLRLMLVNPARVRALHGHKTDRIDARRIAEFLQYGLLQGSFIPSKPVRQMRDLTRMRVHIQHDRNRVINRIGGLLETVNIKLGSVASNIVGKSGRAILDLLAAGSTDAERMADKAIGQLRNKLPELILALDGRTDDHFRWMLSRLLEKLDGLDAELAGLDRKTEAEMEPHQELIGRLCTIPGIEKTTARVLISELGTDMTQFPDSAHAASWAGLCPGNSESAGKRFSGKTRKGDRYLRRILVQSAWAAARTKDCFFNALFYRVAQKRGMKKAAVAVAHRLLAVAYILIRDGGVYYERGGDYFDRRNPERTAKKLSKRLEKIGFQVVLTRRPLTPVPPSEVVAAEVCSKCHKWRLGQCIHDEPRPKRTNKPRMPKETTT